MEFVYGFSEQPTDDSVGELLSRMYPSTDSTENSPSELDEKQAREEAKRLALLQDEIVDLMKANPKYHLGGSNFLVFNSKKGNIGGIGTGEIHFSHFVGEEFPNALLVGVKSPNNLVVYLHTDLPTLDAAKKITDQHTIKKFETHYFFNTEGDYGKLVYIHRSIRDERQDVFSTISHSGSKTVVGEMNSGDFELAGQVLGMIKARLTLEAFEINA